MERLTHCATQGPLVICEVVYAELAASFATRDRLDYRLESLGIELVDSRKSTLYEAGQIFARYRQAGGIRAAMVPDFLIGAHASLQADQLATTDRGYLRQHFAGLKLLAA